MAGPRDIEMRGLQSTVCTFSKAQLGVAAKLFERGRISAAHVGDSEKAKLGNVYNLKLLSSINLIFQMFVVLCCKFEIAEFNIFGSFVGCKIDVKLTLLNLLNSI